MDLRILKCFDGLHYSFELLDYYYSDLYSSCTKINTDNSNYIKAIASCWGFIDALHRIREIAQALPGLSNKELEMRLFLTSTVLAETYRHYIQHLRGELLKRNLNPFPVWGSLAWVDQTDSTRSHTIIIGTPIPGTEYAGCVYDTVDHKWVSRVCLGVNNYSFNFDPIYESCIRFKRFIITWIKTNTDLKITVANKVPIITATINPVDIAQPATGAAAEKFATFSGRPE